MTVAAPFVDVDRADRALRRVSLSLDALAVYLDAVAGTVPDQQALADVLAMLASEARAGRRALRSDAPAGDADAA
ncbi:MAG: hypothetical protein MUE62_06320 [Burkholderiaceae bacterium]|jgi:hypothetical protein|nr:hypothetical protein [Burkholderiaceae bacterium]